MFFTKIIHFVLFAAYLQGDWLRLLGCSSCVDMCAITSLYFVESAVTETLPGVYELAKTNVAEFKVQHSLAPWLRGEWPTPGLEGNPFQFLIDSFPFLDTGARTAPSPYTTRLLDGVTPTSSRSADVPVHAYNAGLSAGVPIIGPIPTATPHRLRSSVVTDELDPVPYAAPTPSVSAALAPTPPDEWAFDGPLPTHPNSVAPAHTSGVSTSVSEATPLLPQSSAGPECLVAAPVPTVAATSELFAERADLGQLERLDRPERYISAWFNISRAFERGWALSLVASIAVQVLVTAYLYRYYALRCTQNSEASPVETVVQILDQYNLSTEELRAHIEQAVSARTASVRDAGDQGTEDLAHAGARQAQVTPLDENQSPVNIYRSVGVFPSVASTTRSQTGLHLHSATRTPSASDGPSVSGIDSVVLADRIRKISEDIRQDEQRLDQALDELVQLAGEFPRRSFVLTAPTAQFGGREVRGNARRDEFNASPLAHRNGMLGRGLPTANPPHRGYRSEVRRPDVSVNPLAHVEEPGSMMFDPVATSSAVRNRLGRIPVQDSPTRSFEAGVSSKALTDISSIFAVSEAPPPGRLSSVPTPSASRTGSALALESVPRQRPGELSSESPYARPPARQSHRWAEDESSLVVYQHKRLVRWEPREGYRE
ncbi:hypothetical protein RhiJN_20024 [Ceratobasidium sp. AG-Ba]|nr:hypothetical protein RhiJN_20024 [Ceratobasidium sp. AG-Ba]